MKLSKRFSEIKSRGNEKNGLAGKTNEFEELMPTRVFENVTRPLRVTVTAHTSLKHSMLGEFVKKIERDKLG